MIRFRLIFISASIWLTTGKVYSQDPHFSQYFATPLTLNPALTASMDGAFRVATHLRQQWPLPGSPYTTAAGSFEHQLLRQRIPENDKAGIGVMFMEDESLTGGLKTTYASLSFAYQKSIDEFQRIGAGFQGTYGNRRTDPNRLSFHNQFDTDRFNTALPSGEPLYQPIPPTLGLNAGILYHYEDITSKVFAGASIYHVNRPRISMVNDSLNRIAARGTIHFGSMFLYGANLRFTFHGCWQTQGGANETSLGGAVGYDMSPSSTIFAGAWCRFNESVYPYVSLVTGPMQFAMTYDFTISRLRTARPKYTSIELSFIYSMPDDRFERRAMPWYY
jgi:type IX secretion system PorP/SprF family membrane protein